MALTQAAVAVPARSRGRRACVFFPICGNLDDSDEGGDVLMPLCEPCFLRISERRAKRRKG